MIPALPLLVHLLHVAPGGTDLSTDYSRVRVLRTTSELELDLETTSMEMLVDGEPAEGGRGPGGGGSSLVRRAVLVEHMLEGGADGPRHVQRSFESLHDESTFSFGEDERTNESDYPLAGVTLEMTRDDQGEVKIELSEGAETEDSALLEGHDPVLALDSLLPEGAVEKDATWKLDHEQITRALATALDPRLFPQTPPGDFGRERGGERGRERRGPGGRGPGGGRNLGLLQWEGKATLSAVEEDPDGEPCARVQLELKGSGDLPEPNFRGGGRGFVFEPWGLAAPREGTVRADLKGELLVSLATRRPVSLELDGEMTIENSFEREREGRTFSSHSVQSGRLTLNVQIDEE